MLRVLVHVLACYVLLLATAAYGSPPAPPKSGVLPRAPAGKVVMLKLEDLSAEQQSALTAFQASRVSETQRMRARLSQDKRSEVGDVYVFEADESYVSHLDGLLREAIPASQVEGKLQVELSKLDRRTFSGFEFRGYFPEGPTRAGPWTWMSRLLTAADGSIVSVNERNFKADGTGVVVYPEYSNVDINGSSGELMLHVSPSGRELWVLIWSTPAKRNSLYLYASTGMRDSKKRMIEMARSLR